MPSDDYAPVVRGGLKLKGSSSTSGIKKKKKKTKTINEEGLSRAINSTDPSTNKIDGEEEEAGKDVTKKEDEDEELDLRELEQRAEHDGKTATERAYEETRRKRVSPIYFL
jgi:protein FAM32A